MTAVTNMFSFTSEQKEEEESGPLFQYPSQPGNRYEISIISGFEYYTEWYPNGQKKIEGFLKDGRQEWTWHGYYMNGERSFNGMYLRGLKQGFWETLYDSGSSYEDGMYDLGRKIGIWCTRDMFGNIILSKNYN